MGSDERELSNGTSSPSGGILPPIPTPFKDGKPDFESLQRILDHLGDHVDGVLLGGSVGEMPSLTLQERFDLIAKMEAYRASGKRVAVSIADNSIENTRVLAKAAADVGADYVMVSCPSYYSNSDEMLKQYFDVVAGYVSGQICIYDNPYATHTEMSISLIKDLAAAIPQISAIKITDKTLGKVTAVRESTSLTIFSGEDAVLLHQLAEGVDGMMVALPLIFPAGSAQLFAEAKNKSLDSLISSFGSLAPYVQVALGGHDYPAVIKSTLKEYGVIDSAEVRLPLTGLAAGRAEQARVCAAIGNSARGTT